ncbi:MAG: hypothetical protein WD603_01895 [Patescibacteria group bacterium]
MSIEHEPTPETTRVALECWELILERPDLRNTSGSWKDVRATFLAEIPDYDHLEHEVLGQLLDHISTQRNPAATTVLPSDEIDRVWVAVAHTYQRIVVEEMLDLNPERPE